MCASGFCYYCREKHVFLKYLHGAALLNATFLLAECSGWVITIDSNLNSSHMFNKYFVRQVAVIIITGPKDKITKLFKKRSSILPPFCMVCHNDSILLFYHIYNNYYCQNYNPQGKMYESMAKSVVLLKSLCSPALVESLMKKNVNKYTVAFLSMEVNR